MYMYKSALILCIIHDNRNYFIKQMYQNLIHGNIKLHKNILQYKHL